MHWHKPNLGIKDMQMQTDMPHAHFVFNRARDREGMWVQSTEYTARLVIHANGPHHARDN